MIGGHFWREPPQENESRTVIGLFRERNVCRFEAAAWDGERCVTPAQAAAKETMVCQACFAGLFCFKHFVLFPANMLKFLV